MTTLQARLASKPRKQFRKGVNWLMLSLSGLFTLLAVIPLAWILVYVVIKGAPVISLNFFTNLPTPTGIPGGGILNSLVGSAITVGIGALIAAPVGVMAAIFLFYRGQTSLGTAVRFATDVIAGVPSIVMGIFAYTIVVLPQRHFSAFSGGVVLSFIMLPIVLRTTEEMLGLIPKSLREGSLALGAAEWKTSLSVILPAAANGVLTGLMLAIARAAGEAAPMLFTAFGNPFLNFSPNQPVSTLPQTIFVYAISPYNDLQANAWGTALVLIVLVLLLNIAARAYASWRSRKMQAN